MTLSHPKPLESFSAVRDKIYGRLVDQADTDAIVLDVVAGLYSDIEIPSCITACRQPMVNLLRDELLDAPLVCGDETELQVLKSPAATPRPRAMWAQITDGSGKDGTRPPILLFSYSPGRSTKTAMTLCAGIYAGSALMTDVDDGVADTHKLVRLGCWTHCRRYVYEALLALPKDQRVPHQLAARFIALLGKLYRVEARVRHDHCLACPDAMRLGRTCGGDGLCSHGQA